jgi:hypothetical protein
MFKERKRRREEFFDALVHFYPDSDSVSAGVLLDMWFSSWRETKMPADEWLWRLRHGKSGSKKKTLPQVMVSIGAIQAQVDWARDYPDIATAWAKSDDASYLLWTAARLVPKEEACRDIVVAAAACARKALRFVPEGEPRPRVAIEAAEEWARGKVTVDAVNEAADGARAAQSSAETKGGSVHDRGGIATNRVEAEAYLDGTAEAWAAQCAMFTALLATFASAPELESKQWRIEWAGAAAIVPVCVANCGLVLAKKRDFHASDPSRRAAPQTPTAYAAKPAKQMMAECAAILRERLPEPRVPSGRPAAGRPGR